VAELPNLTGLFGINPEVFAVPESRKEFIHLFFAWLRTYLFSVRPRRMWADDSQPALIWETEEHAMHGFKVTCRTAILVVCAFRNPDPVSRSGAGRIDSDFHFPADYRPIWFSSQSLAPEWVVDRGQARPFGFERGKEIQSERGKVYLARDFDYLNGLSFSLTRPGFSRTPVREKEPNPPCFSLGLDSETWFPSPVETHPCCGFPPKNSGPAFGVCENRDCT